MEPKLYLNKVVSLKKKKNKCKSRNQWNWKQKKTVEKISKTKSWFFEKINKIAKHVAALTKKNRDHTDGYYCE